MYQYGNFQIKGMGSVAGAPYLSAYAKTELAMYEETLLLSTAGLIDNIENLENDDVYIFQGLLDTIVPWSKNILIQMALIYFVLSTGCENENPVSKLYG